MLRPLDRPRSKLARRFPREQSFQRSPAAAPSALDSGMHCRLLIPDSLPQDAALLDQLARHRFPALETLLARGRRKKSCWQTIEQWLLERFEVARQHDWPSAPYALLGEGGAPGDGFWVHADPVHLRLDRDRILIADASMLSLSPDEAESFAQSLREHFGEAFQVYPLDVQRWYARLGAPPQGPTVLPGLAAREEIETRDGSLAWHALLNEIQMLLHEHPVNAARELRGELAVNSLWLRGGGRIGDAKAPGLNSVLADHPLALGLAARAGVRAVPLAQGAERWLDHAAQGGVHLAVLGRLSPAARCADSASWLEVMDTIERDWLAPLLRGLVAGRLGMVTLHLSGGDGLLESETTRIDLRRLWRIRRSLDRYLAPSLPSPAREGG